MCECGGYACKNSKTGGWKQYLLYTMKGGLLRWKLWVGRMACHQRALTYPFRGQASGRNKVLGFSFIGGGCEYCMCVCVCVRVDISSV